MRFSIRFLLLFFIMLGSTNVFAQEQDAPLDETVWQDLVDDIDYSEEEVEPKKNDGFKLPNIGLTAGVFKYVFFFLVLGILIFFLVRYLLTLQGNAAKTEEEQIEVHTLKEAEDNPMKANLPTLIERLIGEGKYREATRAYFLLVLQRMYKQQIVEWKKPKTNFDYVREVDGTPLHKPFSKLTYYFELIWYGSQHVDQRAFEQIEPEFKRLLAKVNGNG